MIPQQTPVFGESSKRLLEQHRQNGQNKHFALLDILKTMSELVWRERKLSCWEQRQDQMKVYYKIVGSSNYIGITCKLHQLRGSHWFTFTVRDMTAFHYQNKYMEARKKDLLNLA